MTKDLEHFGLNAKYLSFAPGANNFYMLERDKEHKNKKQADFPAMLLEIDLGSDLEAIGWENETCEYFRSISTDGCYGHSYEKYFPAIELKEFLDNRKYKSAIQFFMENHWIKHCKKGF